MTSALPRIQWVGPLPPRRTGIAGYCADLLNAVDGSWSVELMLEAGSRAPGWSTIRNSGRKRPDRDLPVVAHLGNSEHHELAFRAAESMPGIVVLHDVVLHSAVLLRHLGSRNEGLYWQELRDRYGEDAVSAVRAFLTGRGVENLHAYPMSDRYIEGARLVIVHSQHAASRVKDIVPGARVHAVPMGVPLPQAISREEARRALDLPVDQFIAASITHINPNKRISSVLRAMRRLVTRLPEARLVVAGSNSDSHHLRREIRMLGMDRYVTCYGYVDDVTARLLAAAADASVNLRYPSTGETSASLLRLLGAGRPVLITDDGAASETPPDVAIKIKPDEYEVEIIEEALLALAGSDSLRDSIGAEAREWVRTTHSMGAAVDGYRGALEAAYGIRYPGLPAPVVEERLDVAPRPGRRDTRDDISIAGELVADALAGLRLSPDLPIVRVAAGAINDLGIAGPRKRSALDWDRQLSDRLLSRLACPACRGGLDRVGDQLECPVCLWRVPVSAGVPRYATNFRP